MENVTDTVFRDFAVVLGGGALLRRALGVGNVSVIGMLALGVVLSLVHGLDAAMTAASPLLRELAFNVVLLRAGLALDHAALAAIGWRLLPTFLAPATLEALGVMLLASVGLGFAAIDAALLGVTLAALSPALVIPKTLELQEKLQESHTRSMLPAVVLAAAPLEVTLCVAAFGVLLPIALRASHSSLGLVLGILCSPLAGALTGLLVFGLTTAGPRRCRGRFRLPTVEGGDEAMMLFAASVAFSAVAKALPISAPLGILSMAFVFGEALRWYLRGEPEERQRLERALNEALKAAWFVAEPVLFVLIAAALDLSALRSAGWAVVAVLAVCAVARAAGALAVSFLLPFSRSEGLFFWFSTIPKATVQAALGGIPLAGGNPRGEFILAAAVSSILVFATLGVVATSMSTNWAFRAHTPGVAAGPDDRPDDDREKREDRDGDTLTELPELGAV